MTERTIRSVTDDTVFPPKTYDVADGYDILPEGSSVYVTGDRNVREIPANQARLTFGE